MSITKVPKNDFHQFINSLESQPLHRSFLFVFTWIFLRIFFEGVLEFYHRIGYGAFSYETVLTYFIHSPLFYLNLFFILVIIISLITREEIQRVTAVASVGLGILLFVPILDWFIGGGYLITYPLRIDVCLVNYLNPFISLAHIGISPGQRITVVLTALLIMFYALIKTKKIFIGFLLLLCTLLIIPVWGGLTTIVAGNRPEDIYLTGGILYTDGQKYAAILALQFIFLSVLYCYMLSSSYFKIILQSLRIERIFFYSGLGIGGFLLAIHQKGIVYKTNLFDALGILLLTLSLAFGFQSAQVLNDFFDVGGDQFTRTRNPLLKSLPRRYYAALGLGLTFLSLCLAMILSFTCFLIMFTCILLSIIYSVPPVRIKIVPIVAMFILAVTALLSITMGFSLLYGNRALDAMPKAIVIPTLLGITFGFIAKDIADIEGDKKSGTVTVPILLLKHNKSFGRLLLAIFISISYLFFPIFIPETLIGAIIFFLVTLIYTIFIKETKEWFYFLLLYSFSLYLMFIIGGIPPLK